MFELISPVFRRLYESTGVNFVFLYDPYEYGRFVNGVLLTIELGICCLLLSVLIGILGAWAQEARSRILRLLIAGYIQAFRNTPPIVQLLFFYFALGALTPKVSAGGYSIPIISAFDWAVISLGCFGGAFNVEIFRSGIEAVPHSTREAGEALGYTKSQAFFYITLPLALRFCLPALTNNLVSLLKTTSLAYAITVPEVTLVSSQIWSDNLNVAEMMLTLFIFYNLIVAMLAWAMHRLERALKIPGYG